MGVIAATVSPFVYKSAHKLRKDKRKTKGKESAPIVLLTSGNTRGSGTSSSPPRHVSSATTVKPSRTRHKKPCYVLQLLTPLIVAPTPPPPIYISNSIRSPTPSFRSVMEEVDKDGVVSIPDSEYGTA
jgi:hypothetical protein